MAIADRVRAGKLGFVALHASYASKPFRDLLGPACAPRAWREDGRPEKVEVKAPDHPIARGIAGFTIPKTAMFSEPFAVPEPEAVVFVSRWEKGESFRSGLTWTVGKGRVAYFRPGHDGYPILFHPTVRQVIANAALWAAPSRSDWLERDAAVPFERTVDAPEGRGRYARHRVKVVGIRRGEGDIFGWRMTPLSQ